MTSCKSYAAHNITRKMLFLIAAPKFKILNFPGVVLEPLCPTHEPLQVPIFIEICAHIGGNQKVRSPIKRTLDF